MTVITQQNAALSRLVALRAVCCQQTKWCVEAGSEGGRCLESLMGLPPAAAPVSAACSRERQKQRLQTSRDPEMQCQRAGIFSSAKEASPHLWGGKWLSPAGPVDALFHGSGTARGSVQGLLPAAGLRPRLVPLACGSRVFFASLVLSPCPRLPCLGGFRDGDPRKRRRTASTRPVVLEGWFPNPEPQHSLGT